MVIGLYVKKIITKLNIPLDDKKLPILIQFIKFSIIGISNSIISYVINVLVITFLKPYHVAWDYVAGNLLSFFLSVLWSFYWNNRLVFVLEDGQSRNRWKVLFKTYIAYGLTGILLTNILSYVWIDVLGISKYISPMINLIICVPINFIINKLWAFQSK